jgi:hypothetical protein
MTDRDYQDDDTAAVATLFILSAISAGGGMIAGAIGALAFVFWRF